MCLQEEEERKAREEQAQREHEEYLKLKEAFVVEEEGVGESMTEEEVGPGPRGPPGCTHIPSPVPVFPQLAGRGWGCGRPSCF